MKINSSIFLLLVLCILFGQINLCWARNCRYFKSLVTVSRFDNPSISKVLRPIADVTDLFVGLICHLQQLGDTCCVLPNNKIIFTNLVVSGGITDPLPGDKALCYTPRPSVIYPSPEASLDGSPSEIKAPQKKLDNLEDGIYGRDINECYSSDSLSRGKCFLLVTLPNSRNLSKVTVWVQPKGANFDKGTTKKT